MIVLSFLCSLQTCNPPAVRRDSNLLTQISEDNCEMARESNVKRRKVQTPDWKQHIKILRNKEK